MKFLNTIQDKDSNNVAVEAETTADKIVLVDTADAFAATNIESALSELFTYANNGKTAIANAIVAKGATATSSDTFALLATEIGNIPSGGATLTGDALVSNVLLGKTFYKDDATTKLIGTMVNRTGTGLVITPNTSDQTIPIGYYDGNSTTGKVAAVANAVAGNIKSGVSIAGVSGNLTPIQYASGQLPSPVTGATYSTFTITGISFQVTSCTVRIYVWTSAAHTTMYVYELLSDGWWVRTTLTLSTGITASPTGGTNSTTTPSATYVTRTEDGFIVQIPKTTYGVDGGSYEVWGYLA